MYLQKISIRLSHHVLWKGSTLFLFLTGCSQSIPNEQIQDDLNPALPSSIAPFFNTAGGVSARDYGQFWFQVMSQTQVDILMLQDGIGVNHADLEQLPEWYRKLCAGVRAAGKACWSDLENFVTDQEGNFIPAATERLIQQHQIAAQYVDRIVTFSFLPYMSPVDADHGQYFKGYQAYVAGLSK